MYENTRIFSEYLSDTPVMENLSINEEIQIFTIKSPPKTRFAINFSDTDNGNTDKNIILQSHSQSNGDEISKVKPFRGVTEIQRLESDVIDFKKFISVEINALKQEISMINLSGSSSDSYTECKIVNDTLERENKKLKEEVTELRQMVEDLVANFNFKSSRQNHSCITDEKPSQIINSTSPRSEEKNDNNKWLFPKRASCQTSIIPKVDFKINHRNYYDSLTIEGGDNSRQECKDDENQNKRFPKLSEKDKKQHQVTSRRPSTVVNRYPEREKTFPKKVVPGNTSYSDSLRHGKKTCVFGTSMIKGIRTKEFNSWLKNHSAQIRPFPGATIKQLHHYIIPTLIDDTPDVIIIHGGCNDILSRGKAEELLPNEIALGLISIANLCREKGVNEVFISSIICRKSRNLNDKVCMANEILKRLCEEHKFIFIDNGRINEKHLWKDGMHLLESGKIILANNFIDSINNLS